MHNPTTTNKKTNKNCFILQTKTEHNNSNLSQTELSEAEWAYSQYEKLNMIDEKTWPQCAMDSCTNATSSEHSTRKLDP